MKNSVQLFTPDFLNIQYVDRPKCDNWLHQLNFFNNWLDTLRDELNSKDLWEEIGKYQSSIEPHLYQETTNDNFTKEEIEKLLSGIEQVKGYLQEHSTASEYQIDSAIAQLDYLAEAANRQGRKDWFHTCIGVLVTISVALALAPEQAKYIWRLLTSIFHEVIEFLPK